MSYSTSGLKAVLEFVLDHVGENQALIKETNETMMRHKKENDESMQDVTSDLEKMVKDLSAKIKETATKNQFSELQDLLE
jgi:hypothetical protein